jgi:hypothetical protein
MTSKKPKAKAAPERRPRETRYWTDARWRKPQVVTRGFCKSDEGSIEGAARRVARGLASKVQSIDRSTPGHDKVLWTVKALPRIPGVPIIPYSVVKGDGDKPSRKRDAS